MARSAYSILVPVPVVVLSFLSIPTHAQAQTVDTITAEAVLSDSTPTGSGMNLRPVEYFVDLGTTFVSIMDVTFSFAFSPDDPLDFDECLDITGDYPGAFGFCPVGPSSELERVLTFPCAVHPDVCTAYLDGSDGGLITAMSDRFNKVGRRIGHASVTIDVFAVTVTGVVAQ